MDSHQFEVAVQLLVGSADRMTHQNPALVRNEADDPDVDNLDERSECPRV